MLLLLPLALAQDTETEGSEATEPERTFPVLDVVVTEATDDRAFRELAEAAGPVAFQCLVEASHVGTVSASVGTRGGALFIEPNAEEGPIDLCIVRALLTAERPELPDGTATIGFGLATP